MTAVESDRSQSGQPRSDVNEALRRTLLANADLRRRNAELATAQAEPIAVVGMACRLPGGVRSPDDLWDLVESRTDAITPFPTNRFSDLEELFGAGYESIASLQGGFLTDAGDFDAAFFGISDREAAAMDPQQRIMLELTWEALENAGIDPGTLRDGKTGTFVGTSHQDYLPPLGKAEPAVTGYRLQGSLASIVSGRIAYTFGFRGPAVTVDTACSSSLTALHLACQSLRAGESSLAVAGGVTVCGTPEVFVEFIKAGGLASDGRCKAFGDDADGTGFAEGASLVIIERLSDAVRSGHRVRALIKGSAINQDGASNGLTAPNGPAQVDVIRQAVDAAGVSMSDIDLVEGHGTGTSLGDPIEAHALITTYGRDRDSDRPLGLGSLKSNVGHTQAASGVAGVIKTIMAIEHAVLPATLHADQPTSGVDWSDGTIEVLSDSRSWAVESAPRRAAVSSFGISGTNAHVVLEEFFAQPDSSGHRDGTGVDDGETLSGPLLPGAPMLWPISAASKDGLRARAAQLATMLSSETGVSTDLTAIGCTLATRRAHLAHRAVVVVDDLQGAVRGLRAVADDAACDSMRRGTREPRERTAMLFSGQGSQFPGMGRALHDSSPFFANVLDDLCTRFDSHLEVGLRSVLFAAPDSEESVLLNRTDYTQAALFATEVALYRLLEAAGITPDVVLGHSIGEISAAYVAGVMSLDDAVTFVAARGRALNAVDKAGVMFAVEADERECRAALDGTSSDVAIAAVNGPRAVVVSGDPDAVGVVAEHFREQGRRVAQLRVSHGFHSPLMDGAADELAGIAAALDLRPPSIPIMSTVTGKMLTPDEARSPEYWASHVVRTVRFADAIRAASTLGTDTWLEVGPGAALITHGQSVLDSQQHRAADYWSAILPSRGAGVRPLQFTVADMYVRGTEMNWRRIAPAADPIDIPTYPFQRRTYWARPAQEDTAARRGRHGHPVITDIIELADGELVGSGTLSVTEQPWLAEHVVADVSTVAGAVTAELSMAVGDSAGCPVLEEIILHAAVAVSPESPVDVQVRCDAAAHDGRRRFTVRCRPRRDGDEWLLHASGTLAPDTDPIPGWPDLRTWPPEGTTAIEFADVYDQLTSRGVVLGPGFRLVTAAWRRGDEVFVEAQRDRDSADFALHPTLLDACLQSRLADTDRDPGLLFAMRGVRVVRRGATTVRAHLTGSDGNPALRIVDVFGETVASVGSTVLRAEAGAPAPVDEPYEIHWRRVHIAQDVDVADETSVVVRPVSAGADPATVRTVVARTLADVQNWCDDPAAADRRLVFLTTGGVATRARDRMDVASAAVWGLIRTVQVEHPDRVMIVDTDESAASHEALSAAIGTALSAHHPQFALRDGVMMIPALASAPTSAAVVLPTGGEPWRLVRNSDGSESKGIRAQSIPSGQSLGARSVCVAVRTCGLTYLDVLRGQHSRAPGADGGFGPGAQDCIGVELAGVVTEVGRDVEGLRPGDRVMGLAWDGAAASAVVTDERHLTPIPDGWTFGDACTVPTAFLTAWQALIDDARLTRGESVVIHSGAGGVGMAAIQIATSVGAEVFVTAHPDKHSAVRDLSIEASHIASSRDTTFVESFRGVTNGRGVDVVLHSLGPGFLDASMNSLAPAGRLVDVTRSSAADQDRLRSDYPGRAYLPCVMTTDPDRTRRLLGLLMREFDAGRLTPLPFVSYDVGQVADAVGVMRASAHIGKVVLAVPHRIDPEGTVLVTGGTGGLGALAARHVVTEHHARHLVLVGRQGLAAPGAAELSAELSSLGADVRVVACDVAAEAELAAVLQAIPEEHPLTAILHAAGTVDPVAVTDMSPDNLDSVFPAKVDATDHLVRLTRHADLSAFVLYSSAVAEVGLADQGNYGAANGALAAFAHQMRQAGHAATAMAWGIWSARSAMGDHLGTDGISAVVAAGLAPMSTSTGLAYLDVALGTHALGHPALLVPAEFDLTAPRQSGPTAPILADMLATARESHVGPGASGTSTPLSDAPSRGTPTGILDVIVRRAASIVNHPSPQSISADLSFRSLGFDSITAVEMRNHLAADLDVDLPATVVFDHDTPAALAEHIRSISSDLPVLDDRSDIPDRSDDDALLTIFTRALLDGRAVDAVRAVAAVASLRPQFAGREGVDAVSPTTHSGDSESTLLICTDSFLPAHGNLTYQRLAQSLAGRADVVSVGLPGFRPGDLLPESVDALVDSMVPVVESIANDRPFSLLGFSTGGLVAHALAGTLERSSRPPESVVLLDTLAHDEFGTELSAGILNEWANATGEFWRKDTAAVTAMCHFLELFARHWVPQALTTPTHLVHAQHSRSPSAGTPERGSGWPGLTSESVVPGRHFAMLTEQINETSDRVADLLGLN